LGAGVGHGFSVTDASDAGQRRITYFWLGFKSSCLIVRNFFLCFLLVSAVLHGYAKVLG
jgi:hypothetical protein